MNKRLLLPVGIVILALGLPGMARASWQTLVDGTSFRSTAAFTGLWNYDYPWGDTHNGSARMAPADIAFSGGVVTVTASPVSDQGKIHYVSGTFYLKQQITMSTRTPVWDISIQARVPTAVGTWPAFWLTGAHRWPPESDIMEFKGSGTVWQNTYNGRWDNQLTPISAPAAWHTYRLLAVMTDAATVKFRYFVDGHATAIHTQQGFVNVPLWLMFDYQMEGSSGSPGPASVTHTYLKAPLVRCKSVAGPLAGSF